MKLRAFLAFTVSDDLQRELAGMTELLASKVDGITWVRPDHIHCTLKFFGNVEEEQLMEKIAPAIAKISSTASSINLSAVGLGAFPNWRYPRVVWAGLSGETERVATLHEQLEAAFVPFGIKCENRDFRLHLTLGRAKQRIKHTPEFSAFIEKQAIREFGSFSVDHLILMKSVLTRGGAEYTPLRTFRFRPGATKEPS
ncbi:MAG: RNA 2',3'-cyclic phosphodiesterase [Deltaproteobacteria bacterium]|nr:RNA 2',3'-cyclic phosphodiesterase [Deltaproteobacteria bacterium]